MKLKLIKTDPIHHALTRSNIGGVFLLLLLLPQAAFAGPDMFTILTNISNNLVPDLVRLAVAVAYVGGVWIFVGGLFELKKMGDYRSMMYQPTDFKGPVVSMLFGACLVWLPTAFEISTNTLFQVAPSEDFRELDPEGTITYFLGVIFNVMKAVGVIAFIRGWFLLAKMGDAQASSQGFLGRGLIHLLFGVISFHLATFTIYTCNTLVLRCELVRGMV